MVVVVDLTIIAYGSGGGGGAGGAGRSGNAYEPGEGGVGVRPSHIPDAFGDNGFFAGGGTGGMAGPGTVGFWNVGGGGHQSDMDGQPGTGGGGCGGNGWSARMVVVELE